jgi:hypothetical protein
MDSVTGPQAPGTQQTEGLSQEQQAIINQGVAQLSAGFLMLMHGEQKKMLNQTAAEMNK